VRGGSVGLLEQVGVDQGRVVVLGAVPGVTGVAEVDLAEVDPIA
jgi:hypothetical protein